MFTPTDLPLLRGLVSLLYPAFCIGCGRPVEGENLLCEICTRQAPRIEAPFCARCSQPFAGAISSEFKCANCENRVLHFAAAVSLYRSRGVVRDVIHDFKYGRQLHLRRVIGKWLSATLDDSRLKSEIFDCIVPVPLHRARERERGFNQAELLAQELAETSNLPLRTLLQRVRYTTTQTRFDRAERMQNLAGAFRLRSGESVQGLRVLLVDDVLTTGSTLSECAGVLRRAGVRQVFAATAARG